MLENASKYFSSVKSSVKREPSHQYESHTDIESDERSLEKPTSFCLKPVNLSALSDFKPEFMQNCQIGKQKMF